ncbi:MAG: GntR family transcriptional regulator [Chloroflexi bacterium]|nr:GntR family transcriptional regulator [Chloroflexota bacterium]
MQSEPLWERVVVALRRAIVTGELAPESHLKEPILAQRFGVSRLPIREAIAQLDREGLVRIEPRRGAFVVGISNQYISDIYECRAMLVMAAIRRTAFTVDSEALRNLNALVNQMDVAVAITDPQMLAGADMSFHRQIVVLSGNRALLNAWEPVAPLIEAILGISDATCSSADLPDAVEGHRRIIRALENHDVATAENLVKVHLQGGERLVHEAIRSVRVDNAM